MRTLGVAVRCDGDERIGAGHVARCLPLAVALAQRGWSAVFVGRYSGLAAWLIDAAGVATQAPEAAAPCGVDPARWDAAIVDDYGLAPAEICELAAGLPVTTLGEAPRCPRAGVLVDYHLDRAGEAPTETELPGPAYAPLDPAIAGARRERPTVERVLVAVGGGEAGRALVTGVAEEVRQAFPAARLTVGSGVEVDGADVLPFPGGLRQAIADCDIAVSGAGLTAYELACAGVPAVLVEIASNQRRVVVGSVAAGTALAISAGGKWRPELAGALGRLARPEVRDALATAGMAAFDGAGAARAAAALERRWRAGPPARPLLRAAGPGDGERLLAWRNDPDVRERSFSSAPVSGDEHATWLGRTLADPQRLLLVVEEDGGTALGQVRLDRDGGVAAVSIGLAAAARGRGLGRAALEEAVRLAGQLGIERLEARIKPDNAASLAAFAAAGFAAEACNSQAGETIMVRVV